MQFSYADAVRRRLTRLAAKPKRHDLEHHHAEVLRHMRDHGITGDDAFLTAALRSASAPTGAATAGSYSLKIMQGR